MLGKLKLVKYTLCLAIAISGVALVKQVSTGAERIDFNLSVLGFTVKVADLAAFAETGEVSDSLNYYFRYLPPKQTKQLRQFLNQSYNVDPVLVYRYSRTTAGIKMLQRIGDIIQLPGNINGFYGLRAAVVQTAQSPEGINLIDFLQRFPTDIKLNLGELLKLMGQIENAEADTQEFIASLSLSKTLIPKQLADISELGNYQVQQQTLDLYDSQRDRHLVTDLYLPQGSVDSIPVIVVSNGLGAKRDRFEELAHSLASHGFGVVIPDHPGSDRNRQKAFLDGLYKENFATTDYIDRPLDISFILNRLEQVNEENYNDLLNLKQVGLFGYSIGGTTGLSLAGAKFDFERLERDCAQPLNLLNISILYQCRALELTEPKVSLLDERIAAAYLFVPFGNSIFAASQNEITIPIMFQVVDRDFLTSLLEEQVPLFNSLGGDSYLVISEQLPHSNVTLSNEAQSTQAAASQVAKTYQNILSLAFFRSYILGNHNYRAYLSPSGLKAISQEPYNLHLMRSQSAQNDG
ncbi:MAG: alpha/beta fold hydrolase [Cyanobacteria bacterium J06623_7]